MERCYYFEVASRTKEEGEPVLLASTCSGMRTDMRIDICIYTWMVFLEESDLCCQPRLVGATVYYKLLQCHVYEPTNLEECCAEVEIVQQPQDLPTYTHGM